MRLTDTIYPLAFITYNHSCVTSQPMQTAVKDQCDPLTETLIFTTPRGERFGGRGDGCKATETRAWKHLWEPIWVSIILINVQWVMHTTELCLLDRIIHKAATAKTIYNLHMQTIRFGPQTMPGFSKSGIFSFLFQRQMVYEADQWVWDIFKWNRCQGLSAWWKPLALLAPALSLCHRMIEILSSYWRRGRARREGGRGGVRSEGTAVCWPWHQTFASFRCGMWNFLSLPPYRVSCILRECAGQRSDLL